MILKENVYSIYTKPKMDQEFKSDGQGHKLSLYKMEKTCPFLAGLNQYWQVLQRVINKINNIVIENYVYSIDSKTKMDQQVYSESQSQDKKISVFVIVENHGFQLF